MVYEMCRKKASFRLQGKPEFRKNSSLYHVIQSRKKKTHTKQTKSRLYKNAKKMLDQYNLDNY